MILAVFGEYVGMFYIFVGIGFLIYIGLVFIVEVFVPGIYIHRLLVHTPSYIGYGSRATLILINYCRIHSCVFSTLCCG